MATATKNGARFEKHNTREGILYIASKGDYDIELYPYQINGETCYNATLLTFARPRLTASGATAKWALSQLMRQADATPWTDPNFFDEVVFPLGRDLNEWVKRPARETYNSRGL